MWPFKGKLRCASQFRAGIHQPLDAQVGSNTLRHASGRESNGNGSDVPLMYQVKAHIQRIITAGAFQTGEASQFLGQAGRNAITIKLLMLPARFIHLSPFRLSQ